MKTTFSRYLAGALATLFLTLLVLGLSFLYLARRYLRSEALSGLRTEAEAISELAAAYYTRTGLEGQSFRLNVALVARASGIDAVICDETGTILLCSNSPLGCTHQGMVLRSNYISRVLAGETSTDTGMIRGIYEDARFVVGVPIVARTGKTVGAVISSAPMAETTELIQQFQRIYLVTAALVLILSAAAVTYVTRRQINPLRQIAGVAGAFGRGDMDARADVDEDAPEDVQELALAFNTMALSLQKNQVRQQEFIANVSHELKTPMTTIGGYVDGMLDGTIPPEKYRQYMLLVSDETKRLSRLVRSMLEISRLQEEDRIPEEQMSVFDVAETVRQVLISFDRAIDQKNLNVEADLPEHPVYAHASADAIAQVVYNLVDNAVKFSRSLLGVRILESDGKLFVSVYNDGDTIPPEELPFIFDRFHKLDKSRGIHQTGWGLGLAIVKAIVNHHGEAISAASADGITTFTFTLEHGN